MPGTAPHPIRTFSGHGSNVRLGSILLKNSGPARSSAKSRAFWRKVYSRIIQELPIVWHRVAEERRTFSGGLPWPTLSALPQSFSTKSVRSSPRPCSASRHKRPFEQSPRNGRLASESCHWRGVASPGGHNIITMRPRPLVVLGNGVERCLGLPERELKILVTVPSPRRMGHVRVPQSSWGVLTWRRNKGWFHGGTTGRRKFRFRPNAERRTF